MNGTRSSSDRIVRFLFQRSFARRDPALPTGASGLCAPSVPSVRRPYATTRRER
jgi:hypothetical protein